MKKNYVYKWCRVSGYRRKLYLMRNQNVPASHLEVGIPMIPLAGSFPKKSSCKMLKSYLSVYMLMDMRCED